MDKTCDLLVIGGGINGVGVARDAAGRGLNVILCEKDDLASHASSASTKLIHGGLRYLEQYAFRLVRESLKEREVLWRNAPHTIRPLRFVLPYDRGMRPAWLLRLGLFLYDHIGGRERLPATSRVSFTHAPYSGILTRRLNFGFEYSDCWVDDARLVALNATDAAERGAQILTRTNCSGMRREGSIWRVTLTSKTGEQEIVAAKAVINAAGPWVDHVASYALGATAKQTRLIKGSHIVVNRKYAGDHCYIFQNKDKRIVFAIPYEQDFTLIGTTDVSYAGDCNTVSISEGEVSYLCKAASDYFALPILRSDVAWSYSGVRSLFNDGADLESAVTRDYVLELDAPDGAAPILSVFGGKLTTYRKLAEHALEKLEAHLMMPKPAWTKSTPLPGGDIDNLDFEMFVADRQKMFPWLPLDLLRRMARAYGTRIDDILGVAAAIEDLGQDFGGGLFEAEVTYLCRVEFASEIDDILWRRTKLGLRFTEEQKRTLQSWLKSRAAPQTERGRSKVALAGADAI